MAYATRTHGFFVDEFAKEKLVCHKMEVNTKEYIIVEEGKILYEKSDLQEDGITQSNISFKKVECKMLKSHLMLKNWKHQK
jgi:hypothetical protein